MDLAIHEASADEAAIVWELSRDLAIFEEMEADFVATPEDFTREMSRPDAVLSVLLATVDGNVAGSAVYFRTFSTFLCRPGLWLEELYVRPEFRRFGVAQALIKELHRRSEGRTDLEVLNWNEGAMRFYESMGAKPESGWTRYRIAPSS